MDDSCLQPLSNEEAAQICGMDQDPSTKVKINTIYEELVIILFIMASV